MGQKVNPVGFRVGIVRPWASQWFAEKASGCRSLVMEDYRIRTLVIDRCGDGSAISRIGIDRGPQDLVVTVNTARPGIVIGRGGQRVDELRTEIERVTGKRARLNIQEIRQPELDAYLVARNVAEQLERRVASGLLRHDGVPASVCLARAKFLRAARVHGLAGPPHEVGHPLQPPSNPG